MPRLPALGLLAVLSACHSSPLAKPNSASHPLRIWSSLPAVNYNDSYMIGNGRLGAAVGGGALSETLYTNEDSVWSGGPLHRVNPSANEQVPVMQEEIRQNQTGAATELGSFAYVGTPVSTRMYDITSQLSITMDAGEGNMTNYERWLDLADSTSGVYYTVGNVTYQREILASEPAGVMAIRIWSDTPGAVSFHVHQDRQEVTPLDIGLNRWEDYSRPVGSDTTVMGSATSGHQPIALVTGAKVAATDGTVSTLGDYVFCKNATEAYIYFQAWSTYRKPFGQLESTVLADLDAAAKQGYADVRTAHVEDYQSYFNRTTLSLGTSSASQKAGNTSTRMTDLSTGTFDPELASLYFQMARYLLISTSRAGSLPPNLQGIWNMNFDPGWGSKYTININLEMNYWPALVTNLADLTSPLFDLLANIAINGSDVAKQMYNASGAVAHHNTDLWADCAPQDNYFSSTYWPSGLGWLSTHIMEQYLFTGNVTFLKEQYHILHDALEFYLTFVTDGPYGWKVTNPSLSPENTYYLPNSTVQEAITMGPTCDNSIIWELVGYALESMSVLGEEDTEFARSISALRAQLPPIRVSYFGGVQEWIYDFQEVDPGHRHFSPLFGMYPGDQITSANATGFNAAKTTLMRRLNYGGGSTGWSRAWSISLSARSFLNGMVHDNLVTQLVNYTYPTSLLDTGPPAPFQIDGNFGAPAGIAEALLQSHELVADDTASGPSASHDNSSTSKITAANGSALQPTYWGYSGSKTTLVRLLPALPQQWAANGGGHVRGLRARGGFEVDIAWDEGATLTGANITSLIGNPVWVTVGSEPLGTDAAEVNITGAPINVEGAGSGRFVRLNTEKGTTYQVTLA